MGLGKTLAIISLILQKKNNRLNKVVDEEEQEIRKRYIQGNIFCILCNFWL
jgi:SNF2 family DNA or RNA helicase